MAHALVLQGSRAGQDSDELHRRATTNMGFLFFMSTAALVRERERNNNKKIIIIKKKKE
jgi:hypothetical protein